MSDLDRRLVGHLTNASAIAEVFSLGLRMELFEEPVCAAVYDFSLDYWLRSGMESAPTAAVLEHEFPGLRVDTPEETPEWLVQKVQQRYATNHLQDMLRDAATASFDDPVGTLRTLYSNAYEAAEAVTPRLSRVNMANTTEDRRRRYGQREDRPGGIGLPYGIPELDEHTGGNMPGELAVIGAYSKCISADSYVFVDNRLVRIGEICPDIPAREDKEFSASVLTRAGWGKTTHLYHRGSDEGVRITSRLAELTCTGEHRVLVPDAAGLVWRYARDLRPGDQMLVPAEKHLPEGEGDEGEAALCALAGWVVAEGHFSDSNPSSITKYPGEDYGDHNRRDIESCLRSVFPADPVVWNDQGVLLRRHQVRHLRAATGLEYCNSQDKLVPPLVMSAGTASVVEFLRRIFEGDGDYTRGQISVSSASRELLIQIRQLLGAHLGVVSRIESFERRLRGWDSPRTYWRLNVLGGDNGRRFAQFVTPLSPRRAEQLAKITRPGRERASRCGYVGRVRHSTAWVFDLIEHLRGRVSWENRPRQVSANNRRPGSWHSLFADPKLSLLLSVARTAGTDLHPSQIIRAVEALGIYVEHLRDMPQWHALVECSQRGYYGSEVSDVESVTGDFWDFTVSGTHSYVCNGVMGHNTGKSFLLCNVAVHLRRQGYTPMLFTLEMSIQEMEERIDALWSGVSYNRLVHARLTPEERQCLHESQDKLGDILVEAPEEGERTVTQLINRARQAGADYVLIDQLSFVEPPPGHYRTTKDEYRAIMKAMKNELRRTGKEIPALLAVQLNRESLNEPVQLKHFADASDVERFCDIALALERNKEERANHVMRLHILGGRRSEMKSWLLGWELQRESRIRVIQELTDNQ